MGCDKESRSLPDENFARERREWLELLTASEALTGLIHELNNTFNTMMLQATLIQMKVTEPIFDEVNLIRREGAKAAARLVPFQRLRDERRQARILVDLNEVVRKVLADYPEISERVHLDLADGTVPVSVNLLGLKQLAHLLVRLWSNRREAPLFVRTLKSQERVHLMVGTGLLPADPSQGLDLLDPQHREIEHLPMIEHLAIQSLVRLLDARARLWTGSASDVAVSVDWSSP